MLNHTYKKVIFPDTLAWKHARAVLFALSYIVMLHACMHIYIDSNRKAVAVCMYACIHLLLGCVFL